MKIEKQLKIKLKWEIKGVTGNIEGINKLLFKDVNITLNSGELGWIKGSNGSGKTTLINLSVGLIEPIRGIYKITTIFIQQNFIQQNFIQQDKKIKEERLFNKLPIYTLAPTKLLENVGIIKIKDYLDICYKIEEKTGINKKTFEEYLEGCIIIIEELNNYKKPNFIQYNQALHTLSTGQQKQLLIARHWIESKPIWLLDEPTLGIDRKTQENWLYIVNKHREQGGMVVLASHNTHIKWNATVELII